MNTSAISTAGPALAQPSATHIGLLRTLRRGLERSACILLFLAVWELLPRAGWVNPAFLSPPSDVVRAIATLVDNGQLWKHVTASLQRSLIGLLLAIASGVGKSVV